MSNQLTHNHCKGTSEKMANVLTTPMCSYQVHKVFSDTLSQNKVHLGSPFNKDPYPSFCFCNCTCILSYHTYVNEIKNKLTKKGSFTTSKNLSLFFISPTAYFTHFGLDFFAWFLQ